MKFTNDGINYDITSATAEYLWVTITDSENNSGFYYLTNSGKFNFSGGDAFDDGILQKAQAFLLENKSMIIKNMQENIRKADNRLGLFLDSVRPKVLGGEGLEPTYDKNKLNRT